jgi:hypothetical protein
VVHAVIIFTNPEDLDLNINYMDQRMMHLLLTLFCIRCQVYHSHLLLPPSLPPSPLFAGRAPEVMTMATATRNKAHSAAQLFVALFPVMPLRGGGNLGSSILVSHELCSFILNCLFLHPPAVTSLSVFILVVQGLSTPVVCIPMPDLLFCLSSMCTFL